MEKLAVIDEVYAKTAQTFPSQSIRYNKPPTPPRRCRNVQRQQQLLAQQQQFSAATSKPIRPPPPLPDAPDLNDGDSQPMETTRARLQRPSFLALRKDTTQQFRVPSRPTRVAPPPPPISASAEITTDPASPIGQEPLNVSLNVTVSPVPQRRPRHTATLDVHPEVPYTAAHHVAANAAGDPPRSYTAVNFTLRPPGEDQNDQSPIEISAGPSFTYSSSSYDARQGYQSTLKITVGSPMGVQPTAFSAIRTRAQSCQDVANENRGHGLQQQQIQQLKQQVRQPKVANSAMKSGISLPNIHSDSRSIVSPLREGKRLRFFYYLIFLRFQALY